MPKDGAVIAYRAIQPFLASGASVVCSADPMRPSLCPEPERRCLSHLICIEGPAGVGKTTLCRALVKEYLSLEMDVAWIDEFSATELGEALSLRLAKFSDAPAPWPPFETMMLCVQDKLSALSMRCLKAGIVILDRGFITQRVLAIPLMQDLAERGFAESVIRLLDHWLATQYCMSTFVLRISFAENIARLERRLDRTLSRREKGLLHQERSRYALLTERYCPDFKTLDAADASDVLAERVIADLGLEVCK